MFYIAVEEIEAWLLGDPLALKKAYPVLSDRIDTKLSDHKQDSVCGTWEVPASILTQDGIGNFRKQNSTPFDDGKMKSLWAEKIGVHLDIRNNNSPSFRYMITESDRRKA